MSRITKNFNSTPTFTKPDMVNQGLYPAYSQDLLSEYLQLLMTNTMGSTFYTTESENVDKSIKLHKAMQNKLSTAGKESSKIFRFWMNALIFARQSGYMRLQPIIGLAYLLAVDNLYISLEVERLSGNVDILQKLFDNVILTPKDLSDFAVMVKNITGGEGGRRIKRLASSWLVNKFDVRSGERTLAEYWAIKYGADNGNKGYTLKDLFSVYHPKFGYSNFVVDYLFGGSLYKEASTQIKHFENLKRATTAQEKIDAISAGRLPHEIATTYAGNDADVWSAITLQMPVMALLKNLATLDRHGVLAKNLSHIKDVFTNPAVIQRSKLLPYRFIDAYDKSTLNIVRDILRKAVDLAFVNLPDIGGNTVVALDTSGSMLGNTLRTASIFAISLMRKTNMCGKFYTFNSHITERSVSTVDSILTQAESIRSFGNTYTSGFLEDMLQKRYVSDNIIVVTDGQQNVGRAFAQVLDEYKSKVNRNVKVFIVDVGTYPGQLLPADAKNVFYIKGWSDKVLNYISYMSNDSANMVEKLSE